jgi:DNA-binding helix-hairpin-helix protein with protein kinase domain
VFWPAGFFLAIIVSGILFFGGETPSSEKRVRQAALDAARNDLTAAQHRWNAEGGDGKFQAKLTELAGLRKEYEGLANQLALEKQKLQQNLRNAQLHKFLDRFFISDHAISGVGPARKATLASFGVETAADVTKARIMRIRGFGPSLADTLVGWRTSLERRFVFDPTKGVDPADIAALNQRFSQKRKQLEGSLLAGHEQLVQIRGQTLQQRSQLLPVLNAAATRVAQAQADLSVV